MKIEAKILILRVLGLLFSTVPVIAATLSYFPLWKTKGSLAALSGFTLLLLLLCIVPLIKLIKRWLASPSAYTMWLIIFIAFLTFSKIAEQMIVISLVGFIGNLIAALLWHFARRDKT